MKRISSFSFIQLLKYIPNITVSLNTEILGGVSQVKTFSIYASSASKTIFSPLTKYALLQPECVH